MIPQLQRTEHALVAGRLALRIRAHAVGAAEIHFFRAVEIAERRLPGKLQHNIRLMPERLHASHRRLRLRERTVRPRLPRKLLRPLRLACQRSRRHRRAVIQIRALPAVIAFHSDMNAVRMLRGIQRRELIEIVLQLAVIIPEPPFQLPIVQMENRAAAEKADGVRRAVRPERAHRAAERIIHTAESEAELRAAVSDHRFIVHIIIVQLIIGRHRAHIDARPRASDIVQALLHAEPILARRLRAVVLRVQHRIRPLAVLHAHRQIARPEILARTQNADRLRAGNIGNRIQRRL